jgi:hypothetical protein
VVHELGEIVRLRGDGQCNEGEERYKWPHFARCACARLLGNGDKTDVGAR